MAVNRAAGHQRGLARSDVAAIEGGRIEAGQPDAPAIRELDAARGRRHGDHDAVAGRGIDLALVGGSRARQNKDRRDRNRPPSKA
jgi:hypothetical protein